MFSKTKRNIDQKVNTSKKFIYIHKRKKNFFSLNVFY